MTRRPCLIGDGVNGCQEAIRTRLAARTDDTVTVSSTIPADSGFYSPRGYACRHGITYWVHYQQSRR